MTDAMSIQIGGDHYKCSAIQPFELSLANGYDGAIHTAIKYIHRHNDKGGREDLLKAIHVCQIRKVQLRKWGTRVLSEMKIPITVYIHENGIPAAESSAIVSLHEWACCENGNLDNFYCRSIVADIQEIIDYRYGVHTHG